MTEVTSKIDGLRSLAEIYTASNLRRIVVSEDLKPIRNRINRHVKSTQRLTYLKAIKTIYNHLLTNYKSEYFYKNLLLNKLLEKYSLSNTAILNEFRVGSSMADFVFLNGEIRIYEIKTDLDDLTKLDKQLSDYREFANKVFVVASSKHIRHLLRKYGDSEIGVIEFTASNRLRTHKEAESVTKYLNHTTIFKTLRKPEYIELVVDCFGKYPEVPNTRIFSECLNLIKTIDVLSFQEKVLSTLKNRKLSAPQFLNAKKTPFELKHLCYTLDFKEDEYLALYSFLNKEL